MHQALSVDMVITAEGWAQDRLSNPCDGGLLGTWPQQLQQPQWGAALTWDCEWPEDMGLAEGK